ncbi:MAG: hypothetical protein CVV24_04520 [Ignavibacteriae bacterium HGW-Ignavibacteriae-3]|nr:MAG: hypothetical protein CVV24_04520 [Ignavibacteriae bacterium HGW-Ignavibacteriae-3]
MFKTINDFLAAWKNESESTLKIFSNLTDESLKQKVTQNGRSLGFLAWHITTTITEMLSKTGLSFDSVDESAPPASAETISQAYGRLAELASEQILTHWSDDMLNDDINMYGEVWKRTDVLASLILHQSHHRGQMTVLMRQAGLKVPGVYGPSREEWAMMGLPEHK